MRRKTGGRLFFFGVVAGSAMLFGSMLFGYGAQAGEDIRDLVLKGIWDNARFIGNVGFRQNEQTFDALRVGTTYLPDTDIGYTYLEEVHRIFGRDHAAGRLEMVIAHPGGSYAGMKMEFPSSVARMDWKTERPFW